MAHYRKILISAGIILASSSCIRENRDFCNSQQPIMIVVEDKNYSNITDAEGETPVSENLPLLSYVTPLEAWWHNTDTASGKSTSLDISSTEKAPILDASAIEDGNYEIVVSGNREFSGNNTSDFSIELHPEGKEYNDIYVGYAYVNIPNYTASTITMKRAKGKLITRFVNLPDNIISIEMKVGVINSMVDRNMNYSGNTTVNKTFDNIDTTDSSLEMFLAPTPQNASSPLTIIIHHDNGYITTLSNINIVIERNKITMIKPTYIPSEDEWKIEVNVDGVWKQIHELIITLPV